MARQTPTWCNRPNVATQERVQKQKTERKTDAAEVKSAETKKVDGEKIKADTLYKLVGGEFVEVTCG